MEGILPNFFALADNPAAVVGFVAAAVVGVASGLHCFLMCGPLACAGLAGIGPERAASRRKAILAYQVGRTSAYTIVGLLLGAVGGGVSQLLSFSIHRYLPWVMALTLVFTALDWGKGLPSIPGLRKVTGWMARRSIGLSPAARSGVIGALTPLLPCGLLYGIFAAALATGSATGGALVMLGFALGSGPALLLAQAQAGLWKRLPRGWAVGIQRGMPLLAAAVIVYRALAISPEDPSCH